MSKKSFFFYGIYEGNEGDETWRVLHDHFEKLAKEKEVEAEFSDRKPRKVFVSKEFTTDDPLRSVQALLNTTEVRHLSTEALFSIFREQLTLLEKSQLSALASTLGLDGKASRTELQDTLMRWFVTSVKKEPEKKLTPTAACFMRRIQLGALWRD
jgi:hypothetical protein